MITRYTTRNSVYEVDDQNLLVRRLEGVSDPTANVVKDGLWQPYLRVDDLGASGLAIEWADSTKHTTHTLTSSVLKREEVR